MAIYRKALETMLQANTTEHIPCFEVTEEGNRLEEVNQDLKHGAGSAHFLFLMRAQRGTHKHKQHDHR